MAKRKKASAIVPRAVFAAAVTIASVPTLGCGGSQQQQYTVAQMTTGNETTGEVDAGPLVDYHPSVAAHPSVAVVPSVAVQMGVAAYTVAMPPAVAAIYGVAARSVAARPDPRGVAARPHKG